MFFVLVVSFIVVSCLGVRDYLALEAQQEKQTAEEREKALFPVEEELNALYYQLDILQRLQAVERIDPYRANDPKYIKKGLATEKAIQTTLKRIRTLEDKKSRL